MGMGSLWEAEDCVGDPIHTLIFDTNSNYTSPRRITKQTLRREELLSLLDHYCLLVGQEVGLNKEVKEAKQQLGLLDDGFGMLRSRSSSRSRSRSKPKDGGDKSMHGFSAGSSHKSPTTSMPKEQSKAKPSRTVSSPIATQPAKVSKVSTGTSKEKRSKNSKSMPDLSDLDVNSNKIKNQVDNQTVAVDVEVVSEPDDNTNESNGKTSVNANPPNNNKSDKDDNDNDEK